MLIGEKTIHILFNADQLQDAFLVEV